VGALTSKDFRFKMRVWFLKETQSVCTSCATGCNTVIGSRESVIHRQEPRENDAVNGAWMCDAGRLNYKWVGRPDRLDAVKVRRESGRVEDRPWSEAVAEMAARLRETAPGSVGMVVSARQTNEELYLLRLLRDRLGALSDAVAREGEADHLLVQADKNPNSVGARLMGLAGDPLGSQMASLAEGIESGRIQTLVVFGEDVTRHGLGEALLDRVGCLMVSDILPNATTARAHYLLPGCAAPEKRGTFTNGKGRVQRFFKAVEPPGAARPETDFLQELLASLTDRPVVDNMEALFNEMRHTVEAYRELSWAGLGDQGATVAF
jgi:NADH-quinone oxidoreductase subunit G